MVEIVETEAYRGADDRASHAYNLRRTPRTEVFFGPPGVAYVYLCYGVHRMLNVITGPEGCPNAVLIRGVAPLKGTQHMLRRRGLHSVSRRLSGGPGLLTQALGVELQHNGADYFDPLSPLRLGGRFNSCPDERVLVGPRVGIAYAQECAQRPWRFRVLDSGFTSAAK